MNKFKKYIGWLAIFCLGFAVGAFAILHLEKKVRSTFVKMIQSGLKVEQEFLGAKAARENRRFESAVHRWVAANAESENGFRIFDEEQKYYNDESIFFPFYLVVYEKMNSTENVQKGKLVVEGLDRGKLAVALEMIGEHALAEDQWQKAHLLMKRKSIEDTKKSIHNLLKQEETDLHLKAEEVVLGEIN
jgi:hypothetical protein